MMQWRNYRTMEEFEREEIRPSFRIGFSLDDIEDTGFEAELSFDEGERFELDGDDLEVGDAGEELGGDDESEDEEA